MENYFDKRSASPRMHCIDCEYFREDIDGNCCCVLKGIDLDPDDWACSEFEEI